MLYVLQQLDLLPDLRLLLLVNAVHDHLAPGDLVPLLLVVALEDLLEGPMAQLGVELRRQKFGFQRLRALPAGLGCKGGPRQAAESRARRQVRGEGAGMRRRHPDIAPVR